MIILKPTWFYGIKYNLTLVCCKKHTCLYCILNLSFICYRRKSTLDSDCLIMLPELTDVPGETTKDVNRSLGLSDMQPDKVEETELIEYTSNPT